MRLIRPEILPLCILMSVYVYRGCNNVQLCSFPTDLHWFLIYTYTRGFFAETDLQCLVVT